MRSWWKLRVVAVVLILGVLTPLLCVHFLVRPEPAVSESPTQFAGATLLPKEITPEIAGQYGIPGYLHLTWKDTPTQLAISRGQSWNGTLLVSFVSYAPDLTDLEVYMDPKGLHGAQADQCYRSEDGSVQAFPISSLLSYWPNGIVKIKAGETLAVAVTVQVPADFPRTITSFALEPTGIAPVSEGIPVINDAVIALNGGVIVQ